MEEKKKAASPLRVAIASFVGTTLEWYDFYIYGTCAAVVFPQLFFPKYDPLVGTMAAFASLAVGYLARPLGSLIFGHYGDKVGRKTMLIITLTIMGLATTAIGLIPSYNSIGVWAAGLLVFFRLLQGVALGGEWGGAALMSVECSPEGSRGLFGASCQMGAPLGLLISTAFLIFSQWISGDAFMDWGWRLPFLVSAVLFLLGLYIRLSVTESAIFEEVKEKQGVSQAPILEVLRTSKKPLIISSMIGALNNITWMTWATFSISYVVIKGVPKGEMFNYVCIGAVSSILSIMFWANVSDKIGRRPLILSSVIFTMIMAFPFYWILDTKSALWIPVLLCVMTFIHAMAYGPQAAFFSEMFEPRVRYTGASMATAIAAAVFGGTAPLIQTALLAYAGGASWAVSCYYVGIASITLIALLFAKETHKNDISISGYAQGEIAKGPSVKG